MSTTASEENKTEEEDFRVELLPEDYAQYDLSFKLIVIGDSGVGKSCLTTKAVKNNFEDYYQATVGFEFLTFNMKINEFVIKMQIWDTCGQEIYKSLISNFYRNSSLAIILYSIDNKESFEHAENWLNDLKSQANPDVRIFLVGNKSDLEDERKVTKEEGLKFKNDQGLDLFMETSAKTGYNARNVLIEAAKMLYADYLKYIEANPQDPQKPGKQKKGEELKADDKKTDGKKKRRMLLDDKL
jgi:small GTP-binding protein